MSSEISLEQPAAVYTRLHSTALVLSSLTCPSSSSSSLAGQPELRPVSPGSERASRGSSLRNMLIISSGAEELASDNGSELVSRGGRSSSNKGACLPVGRFARQMVGPRPLNRPRQTRSQSSITMSHLMILVSTQILPLTLLVLAALSAPALAAQDEAAAQVGAGSKPSATPPASTANSKPLDGLQAAEARDKYSPPVEPPDSTAPSATADEVVPTVAGLVSQDEQQPQARGGAPAQVEQQVTVDADQQLIAAVGGLPSAESTRLNTGSAQQQDQQQTFDNDVPVESAQAARKQTETALQPDPQASKASKARAGKRVFAGHLGVFGRKRTAQSEYQDAEQQPIRLDEPTSTSSKASSNSRSNHYYYTSLASTPTRAPSSTTRAARARGEPNDYREIQVQADSGLTDSPTTERHQFEQQQQHIQPDEQQTELSDSSAQQQTEPTPVNTEAAPTAQVTVDAGSQGQASTDPPGAGYIRLSNIATINSNSSTVPGSSQNSTGEMKLMRIYVIDLDQKLVVGGNPESGTTTINLPAELPASSPTAAPQIDYTQSRTTSIPEAEATEYSFSPLVQVTHQALAGAERASSSAPATNQLKYNNEHAGYVLLDRQALAGNLSQVAAAHMGANYRPTSHPGGLRMQPLATTNYSGPAEQHEFVLGHNSGPSESGGHRSPSSGEQVAVAYQSVPQYIAPQYNYNVSAKAPASNSDYQSTVAEQPQHQEWQQHHQLHQHQQYSAEQAQATYANKQAPGNYTSRLQTGFVQAPPSELQPAQQVEQTVLLDKQQADSAHLSVYRQEPAMYQQAAVAAPADEPGQQHQHQQPQQHQQYVPQNPSLAAQGLPTYRQQQESQQWRPVDYSAPAYPAPAAAAAQTDLQPISPAQVAPSKPRPTINGYNGSNRDHDVVSLANQANYSNTQLSSYLGAPTQPALFDGQHAPLNYQPALAKSQSNNETYVNNIPKLHYQHQHDQSAEQQVPGAHLAHPSSAHQQSVAGAARYNGSTSVEQLVGADQPVSPQAVTNEYPARPVRQPARPGYKQSASAESLEAPKIPRTQSTGYRLAGAHRPSAYPSVSGPPIADGVYEESEQPASEPELSVATRPTYELDGETYGHQTAHVKSRSRTRAHRPGQGARAKRPQAVTSDHGNEQEFAYAAAAAAAASAYEPAAEYPGTRAHAHLSRPAHGGRPNSQHYPGQQAASMRGLLSWETISSAARRLPASLSSILAPFSQPSRPSQYPTVSAPAGYLKSAHYDRDVSAFHRPYPLRHSSGPSSGDTQYNLAEATHLDGPADLNSAGSTGLVPMQELAHEVKLTNSSSSLNGDDKQQPVILDLAEINGHEGSTSGKPARRRPNKKRPARPHSAPEPQLGDEFERAPPGDKLEPAHMAVLSSIDEQLATGGARARPQPGTRRPHGGPKRPGLYSATSGAGEEAALLEAAEVGSAHADAGANAATFDRPDRPERPVRPASVQIGQYRITPQTQFVQSIIEPSRQMLGQYLKQYIGQLGQLAGRLN